MGFWAEVAATALFVLVTIVCLAIFVIIGWAIIRYIVTDVPLPYRDPEPPTTIAGFVWLLRDTGVVDRLGLMYTTKKTKFPGSAVLTAEFAAVATPEQMALYEATMLLPAAGWTTSERDAYHGRWSLFDGRGKGEGKDVLWFYRSEGAVQVAA